MRQRIIVTRQIVWLILSAVLLASCGPVRDRRALDGVEAVMPERPDSALAVLRGMKPRDLPGLHVRPLHSLLLSEALDKNYIDLTDDSLALAANRYYGEHGAKLHRLKSWYYLGRIRFNSGNYAEAVICYDKALAFAEDLGNYHYLGLINRESGNTYSKVKDNYHAIQYTQKSIEAFDMCGEDRYSAYSKLALAGLLYSQKRYEECHTVLDDLASYTKDRHLSAKVSELRAFSTVLSAEADYDRILSDFRSAGIGTILSPTVGQYARMGYVFEKKGQPDSADYYMKRAERLLSSRGDSLSFDFERYRIERNRGNYVLADSLLERIVYAQDSSVYAALGQSVSFYQKDYYKSESQINAIRVKMRTVSAGLVTLLLLGFVAILLSRNRRHREKLINEMTLTAEIRQELYSLQGEKEGMYKALTQLFENRLLILQTLSEQYDLIEEKHQSRKVEKGRELSRDEIIAMFRDKMRELRRNKEVTLTMEETLDAWKDGIMRKFRESFSDGSSGDVRMTQEDFDLVPYFFSGMKYKTISYLTGFSEASLRTRKTRIRQKIQGMDDRDAKNKTLFLDNL
jgi:tetratricopeptide (TPR) repeat protein